jgi:hypothetical protein
MLNTKSIASRDRLDSRYPGILVFRSREGSCFGRRHRDSGGGGGGPHDK